RNDLRRESQNLLLVSRDCRIAHVYPPLLLISSIRMKARQGHVANGIVLLCRRTLYGRRPAHPSLGATPVSRRVQSSVVPELRRRSARRRQLGGKPGSATNSLSALWFSRS